MTLEQLIEQARARLTPEERAARQLAHNQRMLEVNKREAKIFRDSRVTEELLNRVISL
jgi:hypothetical protein